MIQFGKYIITEKISQGNFGVVYKAYHMRTKELVAIKFENNDQEVCTLKNEAKVYQYLGKMDGFPQLKMFGTTNKHNYLVLNLFGDSLETVLKRGRMPLKKVFQLGIQIITRVQMLHDKLLVHRDLKPSNFVFKKDTNVLHLIDFGLAKRYDFDGVHIPMKETNNIIGSLNFVSINGHNCCELSRRDDIESCIYIIMAMRYDYDLCWFRETSPMKIYDLKNCVFDEQPVPDIFTKMIRNVRGLAFDERPNYDFFIYLMHKELSELYKGD